MIPYAFTRQAERMFLGLTKDARRQIIRKLEHYLSEPNPLVFARRLVGADTPTYRFRMGNYRDIFDWEKTRILILAVGHRRDIYRS